MLTKLLNGTYIDFSLISVVYKVSDIEIHIKLVKEKWNDTIFIQDKEVIDYFYKKLDEYLGLNGNE